MGNAIGIDFGTTKTMVSYLNPATGRAELARLGRDRDSIPTTVHVDEAGAFLFGEDADDQIETDPEGYCRAFKLHLGEKEPVLPRAGETAESLSIRFLRHVKEECEQSVFHGGTVDAATITIPVSFAPARKASLKRAAVAAGFSDISFLPEPEAAGIAFLRDNPSETFSKALVLDWGGGTLDIAIISRDEDGAIHADRHCAEGRDDVGGEELDRGLLHQLDSHWEENFGAKLLADEVNVPKLLREAEKVKIALSRKADVTFRRGPRKIEVSRAEFGELAKPIFESAADLVRSALAKNAARGNPAPDSILLIGGTSQAPLVRETMETHFSELRVLSWHHSHEAVALGATAQSGASKVSPVQGNWPNGVPDAFKAAWDAPDIDLSPLGAFPGGAAHPYFGFGAEDEALAMEKGLLVRRKRLGRFAVVLVPEDSGKDIDMSSWPTFGSFDLVTFWRKGGASPTLDNPFADNPFAEQERKALEELAKRHSDLARLQIEIDWFSANSQDGYEEKRRAIRAELAHAEDERKSAEAKLERLGQSGNSGFISGLKARWEKSNLESQTEAARRKCNTQMAKLRELDAECKRHAAWPVDAKTEELLQKEGDHQKVYLKYCVNRHFRIRWEREVASERRNLDGLKCEIQTLEDSEKQLNEAIFIAEKQLAALRKRLSETKSSLAEKDKECGEVSQRLAVREEALRQAFADRNPAEKPVESKEVASEGQAHDGEKNQGQGAPQGEQAKRSDRASQAKKQHGRKPTPKKGPAEP